MRKYIIQIKFKKNAIYKYFVVEFLRGSVGCAEKIGKYTTPKYYTTKKQAQNEINAYKERACSPYDKDKEYFKIIKII